MLAGCYQPKDKDHKKNYVCIARLPCAFYLSHVMCSKRGQDFVVSTHTQTQ